MLLFLDLADARQRLLAGELDCPRPGCAGTLRPWGSARPRTVRINASVTEQYRPRRARCRDCHSTQVLASTRTFPRRLDTAATVGSALMAASTGLGYRRVAERLDLPATTVRAWLRRARANATEISSASTRRTNGMNRRIATYPEELQAVNRFISDAALFLAIGFVLFVVNLLWSARRGEKAPDNPWNASTLEWMVPSPPPVHNFSLLPEVVGHPYDYGRSTRRTPGGPRSWPQQGARPEPNCVTGCD